MQQGLHEKIEGTHHEPAREDRGECNSHGRDHQRTAIEDGRNHQVSAGKEGESADSYARRNREGGFR